MCKMEQFGGGVASACPGLSQGMTGMWWVWCMARMHARARWRDSNVDSCDGLLGMLPLTSLLLSMSAHAG